jgi:hypothetical protein
MRPSRILAVLAVAVLSGAGAAVDASAAAPAGAAAVELSETGRLPERRFVVTGDGFYQVGAADGSYPATGWHIRGEMGGFWTPPIKLLDGLWFAVDGQWLRASRFTSARGMTRMEFTGPGGVRVERVDFAPDGGRAALVGLRFSGAARRLNLTVQAHSELLPAYPWGFTTPSAAVANLPDSGSFDGRNLLFRDAGTPPFAGARPHDHAAVVGSTLVPDGHRLGSGMRGPQEPPVVCPETDPTPPRCDDGPYGKGIGGELTYSVDVPRGGRTVWFAVAGSDAGAVAAYAHLARALRDPARALATKAAARAAVAARTRVDLPGDPLLERSVEWSKQNLADSVQQARDLRVFASHEGREYPPPAGTVPRARWLGAGWPDYPWLFGTDGEYTAFASVAMGQFDDIKAHLTALRDVSVQVNGDSGKVVHEVMPDGSIYYGTLDSAGNTDETSKFPSAVALVWRWTGDNQFRDDLYPFTVRNMQYVVEQLDSDGDGWPEGLGNVERPGMGEEKLDNTVYTIRGLRDLADLARSKGDDATATWASEHAASLEAAFEQAWWYGGTTDQYADSIDLTSNPGNDNTKILQRHWIGVTPMDAELVREGQVTRPLAGNEHGQRALEKRQEPCYSGIFGLFHTGTGPTSAAGGNRGPACDSAVSSVQSERSIFSLNTGIMAVAEGNFGRLGTDEQQRYTTGNARIQLDPGVWEMPGAMPEIAPSPDFKTSRTMDSRGNASTVSLTQVARSGDLERRL